MQGCSTSDVGNRSRNGASIVLAALLLVGCTSTDPPLDASASPTSSPSSRAGQSAVATPTLTPTPPGPRDSQLAVDTLGEVVVTDLVVRSAPGVREDSEILEGRLTDGELVYVFDGPMPADGYDWLLVAELAPPQEPMILGWIAPASREGEQWVVRTEPECPSEVSVESFAAKPRPLLLHCFGGDELTVEGALGFCGHGDPVVQEPPWLGNYACAFEAPDRPNGVSDWPTIGVHIRPGADVPSFTGEATPVRVTGRLDVPEAQTCRYSEGAEDAFPDLGELDEASLQFRCRMAFVLESATPIGP